MEKVDEESGVQYARIDTAVPMVNGYAERCKPRSYALGE